MQMAQEILSLEDEEDSKSKEKLPYKEKHCTKTAIEQDRKIPLIREWLTDGLTRLEGYEDNKKFKSFMKHAKRYFLDSKGRLYRCSDGLSYQLVVEDKLDRTWMMKSMHDSLGHRGFFATKQLLEKRFYWPEMEADIKEYIKTCHPCQLRQKQLPWVLLTIIYMPSIFTEFHADTLHMSVASNRCKRITHSKCVLTAWPEARVLRSENTRALGLWLFEDVICRFGCIRKIITDNAGQYRAALDWIEMKYGITGIQISAYNSQANGKIECDHWDLRQILIKACNGDLSKWYWYLPFALWAERITTRKGMGCSPFFTVTGAHLVIPLDLIEAMWLVKLPDRVLTAEELIGY